jgi:hypothetical protein
VAAKRVAATFGCAYLAGKFLFPDILRLEQKVALCAANNSSIATNFRLFTSGFHLQLSFLSNCFTLYSTVTNTLKQHPKSFSLAK